jgi:integrase
MLLVLYGTGAMPGEVFGLRRRDVDLRKGTIEFIGNRIIQSRRIPVCLDLRDTLAIYLHSKCLADEPSGYIFTDKSGGPVKTVNVEYRFKRLRVWLGISRDGGGRAQPTMRDLRPTFAVHRIATWIRSRADLNRMLPALSAYLGHRGLEATERFLALTPERFRRELNKLSPQRGKKHWRDDPDLMSFLATL